MPEAPAPDVSIHARHYWRASPAWRLLAVLKKVFQSTPAITGERAFRLSEWFGLWCRFNPRPPLLASEPAISARSDPGLGGFNPRPPLLASEPRLSAPRFGAFVFQSTPAITGERAIRGAVMWRADGLFQSTPAITGERALLVAVALDHPFGFQSTPAITGERAMRRSQGRRLYFKFQSTPAITGERASACMHRHCGA